MRKLTATGLILVANLVLLAHAVVPHHHHELRVCTERSHCLQDTDTQNAENQAPHSPDHDHQNGSTDNSSCILCQAVINNSLQERLSKQCEKCSINHSSSFCILSSFGNVDLEPTSEMVTLSVGFSSFILSFLTNSLGFRAPPMV